MSPDEPTSKDQRTDVGPSPAIGLRRRSVILMIILTVVTFGFYYPIWFLRRRRALNSLDSPRKLARWPFVLFLAVYVILFSVGLISGSRPPEQTFGAGGVLVLNLVELAVGILVLVQCFFIKDILEDHLIGPEDSASSSLFLNQVRLSGVMTFFFTIFYLQHVINRDILTRQSTSA